MTCREAESVAHRTYHRQLKVGFVHDAETEARMRFSAESGILRGFLLVVDGQTRTFWIGLRRGDTVFIDSTAFDPNFNKYNVGTVLLLHAIEAFIEEGIRQVDYGFGAAFYKTRFGSRHWDEAHVHVFAPSLAGSWLRFLQRANSSLARMAEFVAKRLGVYQRIKTATRKRLAAEDVSSKAGSRGE